MKKKSKLFSYDDVVKCRQNLNFASYTRKNDGVWWGISKVYLKQNIITAVLRKVNAHSVAICRLIKKSIMKIKIDPRGKIDLNFFAYEVLVRRNLMWCIYLFTPQEAEIVGNSR